ncbi:tryptophan halogenase family protein [Catenovulum sp. SX2]|uniref:tryptophan halogenase family protein n=1 Tax=Catenovulum sp. SX2 TaxID=3398614 RepID=UPI003F832FC4
MKKICILGGGTAGWMTACLMAKHWRNCQTASPAEKVQITLIESDKVPSVGVGEGSTPQLKKLFDTLDISEQEWMPACHATYKNGIRFVDWSTRAGFKQYFHPFPAQVDDHTVPGFFHNSFLIRKGIDLNAHPDHFFLTTYLAKQNKAPISAANFPFEVNYGYHFDAAKVARILKTKAQQLGVTVAVATIEHVEQDIAGNIKQLVAQDGQTFSADYFVDCSGFQSLLLQQSLAVPFQSFANNLFNDKAVVLSVPRNKQQPLMSQTISTALKHGWMWQIPLQHRTGFGYVYSSGYTNAEQAEQELRTRLNIEASDISARHINMRVGQVDKHWYKNCVAIGLSQGFIEPLEATALHIVQEGIEGFIDALSKGGFSNQLQAEYNQQMTARFNAIRDYIVAHYKLNTRSDTLYWRDNAANQNLSDSLQHILKTWFSGQNLSDELTRQQIDEYYPSVSWHCLLAGYGHFPEKSQLIEGNDFAKQYSIDKIQQFIRSCGLNYPSQAQALGM